MKKTYDDIIHLPHHVSTKHPRMTLLDRAAQFSPFAALTGHGDAIKETARLTDERVELDEYMKQVLNDKLQTITDHLAEQPQIRITYFCEDDKKNGGSYVSMVGTVKKLDAYKKVVVMNDGQQIPVEDIVDIEF